VRPQQPLMLLEPLGAGTEPQQQQQQQQQQRARQQQRRLAGLASGHEWQTKCQGFSGEGEAGGA